MRNRNLHARLTAADESRTCRFCVRYATTVAAGISLMGSANIGPRRVFLDLLVGACRFSVLNVGSSDDRFKLVTKEL
jgi:hypothetical protein